MTFLGSISFSVHMLWKFVKIVKASIFDKFNGQQLYLLNHYAKDPKYLSYVYYSIFLHLEMGLKKGLKNNKFWFRSLEKYSPLTPFKYVNII